MNINIRYILNLKRLDILDIISKWILKVHDISKLWFSCTENFIMFHVGLISEQIWLTSKYFSHYH